MLIYLFIFATLLFYKIRGVIIVWRLKTELFKKLKARVNFYTTIIPQNVDCGHTDNEVFTRVWLPVLSNHGYCSLLSIIRTALLQRYAVDRLVVVTILQAAILFSFAYVALFVPVCRQIRLFESFHLH